MPHLGRWASPDPLQVHAGGGGEFGNSYHYVSGNLLQARDPNGLRTQHELRIRQRYSQDLAATGSAVEAVSRSISRNGLEALIEAGRCEESCGHWYVNDMMSRRSGRESARAMTWRSGGLRAEMDDRSSSQMRHIMQGVAMGFQFGIPRPRTPAGRSLGRPEESLSGVALAHAVGHELAYRPDEEANSDSRREREKQAGIAVLPQIVDAIQNIYEDARQGRSLDVAQLEQDLTAVYESLGITDEESTSPLTADGQLNENANRGSTRSDLRATVAAYAFGAMVEDGVFDSDRNAAEYFRNSFGSGESDTQLPASQEAPGTE